ncbi:MAG: extensin family protein [Maritimibacter sp.]
MRSMLALALSLFVLGLVAAWLLYAPQSPLPHHLNPTRPLIVGAPVTPATSFKLRRTVANEALCRAALDSGNVSFTKLEDLLPQDSNCSFTMRGELSGIDDTYIDPLETSCETALRLAMWETYVVQPAAQEVFGQGVSRIYQVGSYNCRKMRTSAGTSARYSTHATAASIDIVGVKLRDGRSLTLLKNWGGTTQDATFLRAINEGACDWFGLVLGPRYNALHADHFHLQNRGWGGCK